MSKESFELGQGTSRVEKTFASKPENASDLDAHIIDINNDIAKAEKFISDMETIRAGTTPTDEARAIRRRRDILEAKINIAELETKKDLLLKDKFERAVPEPKKDDVETDPFTAAVESNGAARILRREDEARDKGIM